jgi:predicted nucleic acid-binding protein
MIVVDTNVIAYLFIKGERTKQARTILKKDAEWMAPILWRGEFQNVLGFYLRKNLISLHEANQIMNEAVSLMQNGEYQIPTSSVLDLVQVSGCSAFDCEYVALARELGIPLVTSDKKLIDAFSDIAISMDAFI